MYTALELYINTDLNIAIVQIRSTIIKGLGQAFIKELYEWIKTQSLSKILLVTGLDQSRRNDSQLQNYDPFRIACYNLDPNIKIEILKNGNEMETYFDEYSKNSFNPGSGLSRFLIEKLKDDKLIILSYFTSEGGGIFLIIDNYESALEFAGKIGNVLGIRNGKWVIPDSWKELYGDELDKTVMMF
jgi:hypothetical protein